MVGSNVMFVGGSMRFATVGGRKTAFHQEYMIKMAIGPRIHCIVSYYICSDSAAFPLTHQWNSHD